MLTRLSSKLSYMSNLAERMEEIERVFGLGVGEIASLCGVSSSAVSQWFGRGNRSTQKIDNARAAIELERRTGWNALWIAYGDEPKILSKSGSSLAEGEPVQPSPTIGTTILQLGALLATMSPMGLKSIASLVEEVLKNPAMAREAAETADAIARTQRMPVRDESISRSFGRAQENPVETGLTPLE